MGQGLGDDLEVRPDRSQGINGTWTGESDPGGAGRLWLAVFVPGGAIVEASPAPCLAKLWLAAVGVEYCSAERRALGRKQDS